MFNLFKQLKNVSTNKKKWNITLYKEKTIVKIIIITSKKALKPFLRSKFKCKTLNISN